MIQSGIQSGRFTNARSSESDVAHVRKLQEFLRREVSAMETYELALESASDPRLAFTLDQLLASHAQRVARLHEAIQALGAAPVETSGVWGAFAKAIQAGADALGDRVAIAALAHAEATALQHYAVELVGPDPQTRAFVELELLGEQHRTHEISRRLQADVSKPS